ncbi:MAG TPA: ribonuclease III [Sedimentisphaerales bacterium]|nr:ribonuclease III [Sedimentisphaerales bacterium]
MDEEVLHQIEQIIGYKFKDRSLLIKAFTHSSVTDARIMSNERLEFLGDSVLGLVICLNLFNRFPDYLEGDLTKIKSMLVSRKTCAKVIKENSLHELLKVGKGMAASNSLSGSLAAGLLEALIAAVFIDSNFEVTQDLILRLFEPMLKKVDAEQSQGNYKSILQQHSQLHFSVTPIYELVDEKGPDHNKCFELEAVVDGRHFKSAWGNNKKDAEQKAALNALVELGIIEPPQEDEEEE